MKSDAFIFFNELDTFVSLETELAKPIRFLISFFSEVFLATFEAFKNFARVTAFARISNFSFISSRSKIKRIVIILAHEWTKNIQTYIQSNKTINITVMWYISLYFWHFWKVLLQCFEKSCLYLPLDLALCHRYNHFVRGDNFQVIGLRCYLIKRLPKVPQAHFLPQSNFIEKYLVGPLIFLSVMVLSKHVLM